MRLRVLVADDEMIARRRLIRLLGDIGDVEVAAEAEDGAEALRLVAEGEFDIVFLDLHMPLVDGWTALRLLPRGGPQVIFVTAHPDRAVASFDAEVADYVLKPVEAERLGRAVARARARCEAEKPAPARAPQSRSPRVALETAKGVLLLSPDEITHAIVEGESVEIHGDRGVLFTDLRLADLEKKLPDPPFERVHRRSLLNLDRVVRLEPLASGGYLAHTELGGVVDVSRKSARLLRKRFGLS